MRLKIDLERFGFFLICKSKECLNTPWPEFIGMYAFSIIMFIKATLDICCDTHVMMLAIL